MKSGTLFISGEHKGGRYRLRCEWTQFMKVLWSRKQEATLSAKSKEEKGILALRREQSYED